MDNSLPIHELPAVEVPQAEGHESSFHHSLHQLRLHLDDMNQRTAHLLRNRQDQQDREMRSDSLTLPTGPAFWELYRALRTDIRGLDARVELVEDRIQNISDRLDALEPLRMTPPGSPPPVNGAGQSDYVSNLRCSCSSGTTTTAADITSSHAGKEPNQKEIANVTDVGIFDHSLSEDTEEPLATADAMTFIGRLKRTSRIKRIIDVEQFLRGSALKAYRLGVQSDDGINIYETENGELNIPMFQEMMFALFEREALQRLENEKYTLDDLQNGRPLVEDYVFKMLTLARYLDLQDPAEKLKATFEYIVQGIEITGYTDYWREEPEPESMPELLGMFRIYESWLKENRL